MQLSTIITETGRPRAAVLRDGGVSPIRGGSDDGWYLDVAAVFAAGDAGRRHVELALEASEILPAASFRFLCPVLAPSAVICLGLNFRGHVEENGMALPEYPTFFAKLPRSLADPGADVRLPDASLRVDYEGEPAIIIREAGRNLSPADAWEAVGGMTILNDVSMRDFQTRTSQWFAGKAWEASTPLGPVVTSIDSLPPWNEMWLEVTVNGKLRQCAALDELIFDVPTVVAELSRMFTLEPGDVIALGTPAGVGELMEPKCYLNDGDVVAVSLTAVGTLQTRFVRSA